jgi:hypothetical protein
MLRVTQRAKRRACGRRMLRYDPEVLIAIGLICGIAVFALARIGDYGITTDEWNADAYGAKAIAWYRSGFTDRAMFTDVESTLWYYGPWFHMLVSAVQSLGLGEHWAIRHAMTFLCGLGGIALLLPIGRLAVGRWAGLVAIVLCLTTGYLYGSLFSTPIDVPFLFAMTAALLGIMLMADRPVPSWGASICAGLLTGLAIATRSSGFIAQAYLVGAMALCAIRVIATREQSLPGLGRILLRTGAALAAGWLLAYGLWPWLQIGNPLSQFIEAFGYFANHPSSWAMPYWGRTVVSDDLPWHYVPGQLAARLPLVFIGLIVVAAVLGIWAFVARVNWRGLRERQTRAGAIAALVARERRQMALLCAATFLPIVAVIVEGSTLYNGLRHVLFVIPLLAVFAAAGFVWLLPWLRRLPVLTTGAVAAYIGLQAATLSRLHPLEYIAFNMFTGGVHGAYGRFNMDYWAAAATVALRRLEERVALEARAQTPPPKLLVCMPWREWLTASMYRRPWRLTLEAAEADYIIATEPQPGCAVGQPVVLVDAVKRYDRAFAWTYARRPGAAVLSAAPFP